MSITVGTVSAGRDVNIQEGDNNTTTMFIIQEGALKGFELKNASPEENAAVADLSKGMEKKDKSLIDKSLSLLEKAAPSILTQLVAYFVFKPLSSGL